MITKEEIVQKLSAESLDRQIQAQQNAAYFAKHNAGFASLYNELVEKEIEYARCFDNAEKKASVKAEQLKIKERINNILTRARIAENEIFFTPVCKKCNDTGYLKNGEFCECVLNRFVSENIAECGLAPFSKADLSQSEFAKKYSQYSDVSKLYSSLKKYAEKYPDVKYKKIMLVGGTGTGKSYALAALAKEMLKRGNTALFASACSLSELFLKYHLATPSQKPLIFSEILNVDFLVIDDLGLEPIYNNVSEQYLLYLLDMRAERGLATAVSTNLPVLDDAATLTQKYGDRIASRLLSASDCWIRALNGNDMRRG